MDTVRKVLPGSLGVIEMRTQCDEDVALREALRPRPGHKLQYTDVDGLRFKIELVVDPTAVEKSAALPTSREDLEVVAAQAGVPVKRDDQPADIAARVAKQRK